MTSSFDKGLSTPQTQTYCSRPSKLLISDFNNSTSEMISSRFLNISRFSEVNNESKFNQFTVQHLIHSTISNDGCGCGVLIDLQRRHGGSSNDI